MKQQAGILPLDQNDAVCLNLIESVYIYMYTKAVILPNH